MDIDDEAIVNLENFVQKQLSTRFIPKNESDNLTDFFGTFYALNPKDFIFHVGDKILIKRLAAHINEVQKRDGDFSHFKSNSKNKTKVKFTCKNTVRTSIGTFFGSSDTKKFIGKKNAVIDKNGKDLHELLYNKTMKLLKTGIHINAASSFSENMVIVTADDSITGHIVCVYCKKQKQVFFDSTYWVLSNFAKHLNLCSKKLEQQYPHHETKVIEEIIYEIEDENTKSSINCINVVAEQFVKYEEQSDIEEASNVIMKNTEKCDGTILDVSVLDENENVIYFQICQQIHEMRSTSLKNGEEEFDLSVIIESEKPGTVDVCLIEPDGNCLVSSLAHQLFRHKLDSSEHDDSIKKLRMEAVEYIRQNLEMFEAQIVWREDFDRVAVGDDIQTKIDYFIKKLSTSGFWCGTETIIAISRLYAVNIIIINEEGSCYMVDQFNFDYKNCAIIAYCTYSNGVNQKNKSARNHYNSVCKINREEIFMCMKKIMIHSNPGQVIESITLE